MSPTTVKKLVRTARQVGDRLTASEQRRGNEMRKGAASGAGQS